MIACEGSKSRGRPQSSPRTQRVLGEKRLDSVVLGELVFPEGLGGSFFRIKELLPGRLGHCDERSDDAISYAYRMRV